MHAWCAQAELTEFKAKLDNVWRTLTGGAMLAGFGFLQKAENDAKQVGLGCCKGHTMPQHTAGAEEGAHDPALVSGH